MFKTHAAYRDTSAYDKMHYCEIYDTAPPTPQGLKTTQEIYEWHDTVPYRTGYTICGKGEYGNGYYHRR